MDVPFVSFSKRWVHLKQRHPEEFEAAKAYEKTALEHGSAFTWSQRESLTELEKPERIAEIEADFKQRLNREKSKRVQNPLRVETSETLDIDDLYLQEEGGGACLVCHK